MPLNEPRHRFLTYYRNHLKSTAHIHGIACWEMIDEWTGTCCAPVHYILNQRHVCGRSITLVGHYAVETRGRFDIEKRLWLCVDCYYKKYPKPRRRDAINPPRKTFKDISHAIVNAKKIYEETGMRYNDSGSGNKNKRTNQYAMHELREIFDPAKANKNLTRQFDGPWVRYRCPHCDFYRCARAYQGYPEHHCRGGWK